MHQLAFDAQMTEKLFALVQHLNAHDSYEARGYLPSFMWAQKCAELPGVGPWGWLLAWTPKLDIEPERVFTIDGVRFYIPSDVEAVLCGRILDWNDEKGVVSHVV
jgi:hypothetical protein